MLQHKRSDSNLVQSGVPRLILMLVLFGVISCELLVTYHVPPAVLQVADILGTWQVRYSPTAMDQFTFRADGTFKQNYQENAENYVFETNWNPWSLQRYDDGRVRLYLQGARYYPSGIYWGEQEGFLRGNPNSSDINEVIYIPFFDPITRELVEMPHLVVLEVQNDSSGKLVLIQMLHGIEGQNIWNAAKLYRVNGP